MKVILLKDVKGIGRKYEEKEVASGHALNFLIPNKLAAPLTGASAKQIQALKENESKQKTVNNEKLETEFDKVAGTTLELETKANEKGHLFGAISPEKVSDLLREKGAFIGSESLHLPGAIKELGEYKIKLGTGNKHFTLVVKQ